MDAFQSALESLDVIGSDIKRDTGTSDLMLFLRQKIFLAAGFGVKKMQKFDFALEFMG